MYTDADIRAAFERNGDNSWLRVIALGADGKPVLPNFRDVDRENATALELEAALVSRGFGVLLTKDAYAAECLSEAAAEIGQRAAVNAGLRRFPSLTRHDGVTFLFFQSSDGVPKEIFPAFKSLNVRLRRPGDVLEIAAGVPAAQPVLAAPPRDFTFAAVSESKWHVVCDALRQFLGTATKEAMEFYPAVLNSKPQIILLRHDWRAAFRDHAKVDGIAEIVLPYPVTVFEFKLGDIAVAMWFDDGTETGVSITMFCFCRRGEVRALPVHKPLNEVAADVATLAEVLKNTDYSDGPLTGVDWAAVVSESVAQVDAACLALSLGVAAEDRKEPCAKTVRNRTKMRLTPPAAYSVMTVVKQPQREPRGSAGGTHASPVPHIRRAHYRNQPTGSGVVRKKIAATWVNRGDLADFVSRVRVL